MYHEWLIYLSSLILQSANEKYDKFICYKDSREPNEYSNPVNKTEIKKKKEFENEYEIYSESIKTRGHAINE